MSALRWSWLGMVLVIVAGCGSVNVPDGTLACSKKGECPSGMMCRADMRCYKKGLGLDGGAGSAGAGVSGAGGVTAGAGGSLLEAGAPNDADAGGTQPDGGGASCPSLDNPTDGVVAAPTLTSGSTATYSCNVGLNLSGPADRTCGTDGTWSGSAPTCSLKDCGPLTAPKDGTVSAPKTTFGSVATYSCGIGFGPSGSATRMCQIDGTWDGSQPSCVVANCPALAGPTGGSVIASTLTFGSQATYSCNSGYTLAGMVTRTCTPAGSWSDAAPTCTIKDCGAVKAPTNGTATAPVTTYGAMASFTCTAGYKLSGAASIMCQTDGSWSASPPTCVLVDCGALTAPTSGTVSATATTFGAVATYACAAGYTQSGAATRTCGADGMWTPAAATCAIVNCGALTSPTNGSVSAPTTTFGATATYSCMNGYGPSGSATRTCGSNGAWDGTAPTCVLANCPALSGPSGGTVSAPTLTFGSTATYACNMGYTIAGTTTRTCQASGTWSGAAATCTIKDCGALTAPVSGTISVPVTTYGATATYACNVGYTASSALTRTCGSDGAWTPAAPTCAIKDCGPLGGPTNGSVNAPTTTYGASATYSCGTGYLLAGAATRTCGSNGAWTGAAPTCALEDCGALTAPANGSVSAPTTTVGGTATYSCTLGYGASGSSTRTCQSNGTWSGTAPTCVIANCPALSNPTGGTVSAPTLTYGSAATYTCNAGYSINGAMSRTCQASGQWSSLAPTCDPKDCGGPGMPVNGQVAYTTTTYLSKATYSCNSGYTLSGSTSATCQSDQSWSGTVPKCVPVDCGALSVSNGNVSYSSTTFGATASFSCNTNYTLSGGGPTVTCLATAKWSATPVCVDICTTGSAGNQNHCCTQAGCTVSSAPDCNTATHVCAAKIPGEGCNNDNQCGTGHCAFGTCCKTACLGPCNSSCDNTGACVPVLATKRLACGSPRTLPDLGQNQQSPPNMNTILRMCDGAGNCAAPKIRCGSIASCDLEIDACCQSGDPQFGLNIACIPPNQCNCGGSGICTAEMDERWYGCTNSLDCPLGKLCAVNANKFAAYGYEYSECRDNVDSSMNWNNEACDPTKPASQCVTNTMCQSFGGGATEALTGECL